MRRKRDAAALAVIAAVFIVGPHWILSSNEELTAHWSLVQSLIGDAYLWTALGFLAWAATTVLRAGLLVSDQIPKAAQPHGPRGRPPSGHAPTISASEATGYDRE